MSRFTRSASWLRFLFTPSHTPQPGPVEVSDDVSLNQPYDGGGYPLFPSGQWRAEGAAAAGASRLQTLITVEANQICRVLAVSCNLTAGVAPDCVVVVQASGNDIVLSETAQNVGADFVGLDMHCPIVGPGHLVRGRHDNGDAATVIQWQIYYCLVPIGTVFYL